MFGPCMDKINVALIGYGLSGSVFHAPYISFLDQYHLKWIVSSKENEILSRYPNVLVTQDIQEVLNDKNIDLVIITTPNSLHFSQAKLALEHHKHVLVEKPFVCSMKEGNQLIELAKNQKKILSVFHNRRYDGDFLTLKKYFKTNLLGEIVYFESHFDRFKPHVQEHNWRENKKTEAGGVLFDLGPHMIDQALQLFGKPQKIISDVTKLRKKAQQDDYFHLIFQYPHLRCSLQSNSLAAKAGVRFLVHGTEGSLEICGIDPQEQQLKEAKLSISQIGEDSRSAIFYDKNGVHKAIPIEKGQYQSFFSELAQAISSNQEPPVSAIDSLLNIQIIIDAINC